MDLYARRYEDDDDDDIEEEEMEWIRRTFHHGQQDDIMIGYVSSSSVSLRGNNILIDGDSSIDVLEYSESESSSRSCSSPSKAARPMTSVVLLDPLMDSDCESMTSQESDLFLDDAYFLDQDLLGKLSPLDDAAASVEYPPSVSDEGTREGSSINSDEDEDIHVFEDSSDGSAVFEDNPDSSFDQPIVTPYEKLGPDKEYDATWTQKGHTNSGSFALRLLGKANRNATMMMVVDEPIIKAKVPNMLKRAVRSFRRRSNRDKPNNRTYFQQDATMQSIYDAVLAKRCCSPESSVVSMINEDKMLDEMWREEFADWGSSDIMASSVPTTNILDSSSSNTDAIDIFCESSDSSCGVLRAVVTDDEETSVDPKAHRMSHDDGCVVLDRVISPRSVVISPQPFLSQHLFSNPSECIPDGLLARTSIDDVITRLHLGVDGWSAMDSLEKLSGNSCCSSSDLPILNVISGVQIPDYNTYVKRSVATFRRDVLGVFMDDDDIC